MGSSTPVSRKTRHRESPERSGSVGARGATAAARHALLEGMLAARVKGAFTCPLTGEYFRDPVVAADGVTYERSEIEVWLFTRSPGFPTGHHTSPVTREPLPHRLLLVNTALTKAVEALHTAEQLARAEAEVQKAAEAHDNHWYHSIPFGELYQAEGGPLPPTLDQLPGAMPVAWHGAKVALLQRAGGAEEGVPGPQHSSALALLRSHPYIVAFLGLTTSPTGKHCIVTEWLGGGSLGAALRGADSSGGGTHAVSEAVRIEAGAQVGDAAVGLVMAGLAESGSIGLALDRVMIGSWHHRRPFDVRVKVSPWRTVTRGGVRDGSGWRARGLEARRTAPEALEHGVFGEPAAVWSLGVLLWELLTDGRMPFWWLESEDGIVAGLISGHLSLPCPGSEEASLLGWTAPPPSDCTAAAWDLAVQCLQRRAEMRPRLAEVAYALRRLAARSAAAAAAAADAPGGAGHASEAHKARSPSRRRERASGRSSPRAPPSPLPSHMSAHRPKYEGAHAREAPHPTGGKSPSYRISGQRRQGGGGELPGGKDTGRGRGGEEDVGKILRVGQQIAQRQKENSPGTRASINFVAATSNGHSAAAPVLAPRSSGETDKVGEVSYGEIEAARRSAAGPGRLDEAAAAAAMAQLGLGRECRQPVDDKGWRGNGDATWGRLTPPSDSWGGGLLEATSVYDLQRLRL